MTKPKRTNRRKARVVITAWELRAAKTDGALPAKMLGRVVQQIAKFCEEARLDFDTQRRVLEMRLAEVEDEIAADSVSWSPELRAIAPNLQGRDDTA
jgi:hypothetical protein